MKHTKCDEGVSSFKGGGDEIYVYQDSNLNVFLHNKWLVIKDWVNGDLGITLSASSDACPDPIPPGLNWPPHYPEAPRDPLVLDSDGQGIPFVSVQDSHAYYDFGGTGSATKTGWIGPSAGFLVEDIGNGQVSLFGTLAQDGFAELATFDSNHDGKVSSADANFNKLEIWRDLNGDGTVDAGELFSLAAVGVTAINLNTTPSEAVIAGTKIGFTGSFTRTDGSAGLGCH